MTGQPITRHTRKLPHGKYNYRQTKHIECLNYETCGYRFRSKGIQWRLCSACRNRETPKSSYTYRQAKACGYTGEE